MSEYWKRFEEWIKINAPHLLKELNTGASQDDINKLESIIGQKLPDDFVEFYKIHNGQNNEGEVLINSENILEIDDIIGYCEDLKMMLSDPLFNYEDKEVGDEGVKGNWWNMLWVPFTHDRSGNHICLDLDPTETGNISQVIRYWHDSPFRELYGTSFSRWFSDYVTGLENGDIVYAKGWGLVDKDSPFNEP